MTHDFDATDVKRLIEIGKDRGYVTYEELSDELPEVISSDYIDKLMLMFEELGINVIDEAAKKDSANHKRGFAGLSELTSQIEEMDDIVSEEIDGERSPLPPTSLPHNEHKRKATTAPKPVETEDNSILLEGSHATPEKRVFALLELRKWPTLPAPWSSVDHGETWVWGDFFFTFQKDPKTVYDMLMQVEGKKAEFRGMTYPYAMSVFYRRDRSPHGPFNLPILVISLEQADIGVIGKLLGADSAGISRIEAGGKMGPLMLGLFHGEGRFNFGEYTGEVTPEAVKGRFFDVLGDTLGLTGQPRMIGDLTQAFGHPETGLPGKTRSHNNGGGSKVKWIALGVLVLAFLVWLANKGGESTNKDEVQPLATAKAQHSTRSASSSTGVQTVNQSLDLQCEKPPVGTSHILSTSQIRWCLREKIRIDTIKDLAESIEAVSEFSRMVDDYNSRCISYKYQLGAVGQAQKQVDANRSQIVAEATEDAMKLNLSYSLRHPPMSLGASAGGAPDLQSARYIREAQHLLTELGYDPGPVDGLYGRRTAEAVKSFQKDADHIQDGRIDENLLLKLRESAGNSLSKSGDQTKKDGFTEQLTEKSITTQPLPNSGTVHTYTAAERVAPLELKAAPGGHYLVKLVNARTFAPVLTVFVRGGATVEVDVPLGTYEIRYASGETWYGYDNLFGPNTAYSKAERTFNFAVVGNRVEGFTITLYKVAHGNLPTTTIKPTDF
jgi:peptidoglycan hydrolase-like protein with peptidoglycan-binding domain